MQADFSCSLQRSKHDRSPIRACDHVAWVHTRTQRQDRAVKLHSFTVLTCHLTFYSNISKFSTLYTATFPLKIGNRLPEVKYPQECSQGGMASPLSAYDLCEEVNVCIILFKGLEIRLSLYLL